MNRRAGVPNFDDEGPSRARRQRSSVLAAFEAFRKLDAPQSLNAATVFLYVCENEGVNTTELAHLCRLSVASVCKIAKAFASAEGGALLEFGDAPTDRRLKLVYLSAAGRALRDELDTLIKAARPIEALG
jgi:DNA-binding MarR family transcriptional regulator